MCVRVGVHIKVWEGAYKNVGGCGDQEGKGNKSLAAGCRPEST